MKPLLLLLGVISSLSSNASGPMPSKFICSVLKSKEGLISNYRIVSVDCEYHFSPVPSAKNGTSCSYSWETNRTFGTVQLELVPEQPQLYRSIPENGTLIRIDIDSKTAFISTSQGFTADCGEQ